MVNGLGEHNKKIQVYKGLGEYNKAIVNLFIDQIDEAFQNLDRAIAYGYAPAETLKKYLMQWQVDYSDVEFFEVSMAAMNSRYGFLDSYNRSEAFTNEGKNLIAQLYHDEGVDDMALYWFRRAADAGYAPAQYSAYEYYREGYGGVKDEEAAAKYLLMAAENGHLKACFEVGYNYYNEENYEEAVRFFKPCADAGNPDAQFALYVCFTNGLGVESDNYRALDYLFKSANGDNTDAQNLVGRLCFDTQDYENAVKMFSAAAEKNHPDAQYWLSKCYFEGLGVEENADTASKLCIEAAKNGSSDANGYIGMMYYHRTEYDFAFPYLLKAAKLGNVQVLYTLGVCYIQGLGVEQNSDSARECFRLSAENGDANAQFLIGKELFDNGEHKEAFRWLKASADQGLPAAQCELSAYYASAKDYNEVISLLSKSAESGYVPAICKLGICYLVGWGVEKDSKIAYKYLLKAAEAGDVDAQYQLGIMYLHGKDVSYNLEKCIMWHGKAHSQGHMESTKFLFDLRKSLIDQFEETSGKIMKSAKGRIQALVEAYQSNPKNHKYRNQFIEAAQNVHDDSKKIINKQMGSVSRVIEEIDKALGD